MQLKQAKWLIYMLKTILADEIFTATRMVAALAAITS
jgi:hypothetical protein